MAWATKTTASVAIGQRRRNITGSVGRITNSGVHHVGLAHRLLAVQPHVRVVDDEGEDHQGDGEHRVGRQRVLADPPQQPPPRLDRATHRSNATEHPASGSSDRGWMSVNPEAGEGSSAVACQHGHDGLRLVRPADSDGGALLSQLWRRHVGRDDRAGGTTHRHGPVRRPGRIHHTRREPRPRAGQAPDRSVLRAARRRHRGVRWARRQAARRRHRRPVRRPRRSRGRRRAGRARRAAHATHAGPLRQ